MKFSFFLLFLSIHLISYSQDITTISEKYRSTILDCDTLNNGVYKTFAEFKMNQPSEVKYSTETHERAWGACNDGVVYYNLYGDYHPFLFLGKLCYLEYTVNGISKDANGIPMTNSVTHRYIIEFDTGVLKVLNHRVLLNLIADDKDLYNEYFSLKKRFRKKHIVDYVKRYNKRQKSLKTNFTRKAINIDNRKRKKRRYSYR